MLIVFRVEMADIPMGKVSRRLYMIVYLRDSGFLCHHLFTDLDSPHSGVSCCTNSINSFFRHHGDKYTAATRDPRHSHGVPQVRCHSTAICSLRE